MVENEMLLLVNLLLQALLDFEVFVPVNRLEIVFFGGLLIGY